MTDNKWINTRLEKKVENQIEKMQETAGDICLFLGMDKCGRGDIEPYKCIQGDYMICDKYHDNYQELKKELLDKYN